MDANDPRHGTHRGYRAGCRDVCCREGARRYAARLVHDLRNGRPRMVPAKPALDHIAAMQARGVPKSEIARAAGTTWGSIDSLTRRPPKRMRIARAEAILAVTTRPNDKSVPALGAQRRVRALMRIGYAWSHISRESGVTSNLSSQPRERILRGTHERIKTTYERLCMTPGPSAITRRRATELGYPSPMSWDDPDDPDERPKGIVGSRGGKAA